MVNSYDTGHESLRIKKKLNCVQLREYDFLRFKINSRLPPGQASDDPRQEGAAAEEARGAL